MDKALQVQLSTIVAEVRGAALPESRLHTVAWCLEKLPTLYAQFRQNNESRYVEEITRLVQGVLKELVPEAKASPEARQLAASLIERLKLLHEEFGLPGLNLKIPGVSPPRSRKVG